MNDKVLTNPGAGASANPEFLTEIRNDAIETPGPLLISEQLLEAARFQRVMSMTAQRFVKLSPSEKRNYLRWANHFRRVFAEKSRLFEEHTPDDIDLPTFLQARG